MLTQILPQNTTAHNGQPWPVCSNALDDLMTHGADIAAALARCPLWLTLNQDNRSWFAHDTKILANALRL